MEGLFLFFLDFWKIGNSVSFYKLKQNQSKQNQSKTYRLTLYWGLCGVCVCVCVCNARAVSLKEKGNWDKARREANVRWHSTDLSPSFTRSHSWSPERLNGTGISQNSLRGKEVRGIYMLSFSLQSSTGPSFLHEELKFSNLLLCLPRS